jgi:hypothetical protein
MLSTCLGDPITFPPERQVASQRMNDAGMTWASCVYAVQQMNAHANTIEFIRDTHPDHPKRAVLNALVVKLAVRTLGGERRVG